MTEIDYLKLELEVKEKAFNRLHKLHMELLKKQGELEKENKQLKDKWFEAERQCLILYNPCKPLDNEIEELKKEIYGDVE